MLEQLLALTHTAEFKAEGGIRLLELIPAPRSLTLRLAVWTGVDETREDWQITCSAAQRYQFSGAGSIRSWLLHILMCCSGNVGSLPGNYSPNRLPTTLPQWHGNCTSVIKP